MSDDAPHPYDPAVLEPKWQHVWEVQKTFRAVRHAGRPKAYILDMFPYPSGTGLHVGHPEGYTATDIISRYKRMNGVDVLHPMGWDAFGLPAEQHAIKTGTHPRATTQENIANFRRQLKMLGFSYDWEREVDTTDPAYVRWTQWIFLQLFNKGLAFQQADMAVNWCPQLGTVLANDEVTPDGRSEVGGFPIEKLKIRQWSLRITQYADRLLEGLEALDWPETKVKQANWIGRSEGANVEFVVEGHPGVKITVFTTRVDTLPGATYVVLAPEHALAQRIALDDHVVAVKAYASIANAKSDIVRGDATREKTGVPTGAFALNPINGERVPVYVADYVIGGYGTGAVMAVPAHDERDHAFAVKYGLPIVPVVDPARAGAPHVDHERQASTDDGVVSETAVARSRAPIEKGMPSARARRIITDWLTAQGQGSKQITYKLRDWVFSRQRYWGEPIPIYFPVDCAGDPRAPGAEFTIHYEQPIPVDDSELPLLLPDLEDFKPGTDPAGPLARAVDWRFFQKGDKWFARETNTMPQWAGSCWYYLRYLDPRGTLAGWTSEDYEAWMPVDLYVGGSEHAVLHLLYARFWHKVLYDLGLVKGDEPFTKLVHQGMILGMAYRYFQKPSGGALISGTASVRRTMESEEIRLTDTNELVEEKWSAGTNEDGVPIPLAIEVLGKQYFATNVPGSAAPVEVAAVAEKMSKSRGNVVNPDDIVKSHGADALRLYEMFMGPLEAVKPWQTSAIEGVRRFLDRTWNVCTNVRDDAPGEETLRLLHKTIKKVTEDIEGLRFHTAIAAMMILVRHLGALPHTPRAVAKTLALLVSPFAPHIGEELWERLGGAATLAYEPWPVFDLALVKDDVVEIGVQVNGKARASIQIPVAADEAAVKALALADPKIQQWTADKSITKVIFVKGRILNLIVG